MRSRARRTSLLTREGPHPSRRWRRLVVLWVTAGSLTGCAVTFGEPPQSEEGSARAIRSAPSNRLFLQEQRRLEYERLRGGRPVFDDDP